jgi:NAD(P)-dependent dehydrogenase (short-subunit alcohol dehydrogenase family)
MLKNGAFVIGVTDCNEEVCAASGRISTQTGTALEIFERSHDKEKNTNLISKVTKSGHTSTVEHIFFNLAFENVSVEEFDKIMAINVKVPFFLTQFVLPLLKKSAAATIINIASVTGHAGYPQQSVYSASKHALLGMTKSIASEYYKENIRVHAISPGGVYTDMVKVTRPDLKPDGMIMPEDIAEIVHFFLANRGNAVVDEILVHRVGKEPFQV